MRIKLKEIISKISKKNLTKRIYPNRCLKNGIIMIIGGLVIAFNIINSSENALLISIVSGIIVTSLGISKKVRFRNLTSGKNILTQH